MLRLTRNLESRIPNRLAIFAAVLLVTSSLAGMGSSAFSTGGGEQQVTDTTVIEPASVDRQASSRIAIQKNKRFKVSLFLFRSK